MLASGRVRGTGGRALRATLSGLGLGLLSEAQLRALDEHYYDTDPQYRTAAWNERGLMPWEREGVKQNFAGRSRIVVPACGGGREVLALAAEGFDPIGYEPHRSLQGYADGFLAEHGHPGRARSAPRDEFPSDSGPCDGVLVGWGAYSLISPRAARVRFLRDAARATETGGPVMVSLFAGAAYGRALRLTARLATVLRRARGAAPTELGDTLAPNRVHVFTQRELMAELREAGLSPDSYRVVAPATDGVDYACAIGRAP